MACFQLRGIVVPTTTPHRRKDQTEKKYNEDRVKMYPLLVAIVWCSVPCLTPTPPQWLKNRLGFKRNIRADHYFKTMHLKQTRLKQIHS